MLEELKGLLRHKKSNAWYAKKLGTTEEEVYKLKQQIKKVVNKEPLIKKIGNVNTEFLSKKVKGDGSCDVDAKVSERVKTFEDLVRICEIDLEQWEVISWECTKWEVGRKNKTVDLEFNAGATTGTVVDQGTMFVEPLYRVGAKLRPRKDKAYGLEDFAKFLETYEPKVELYNYHLKSSLNQEVDIELNIADFHLAKKTLEGESLQNKKDHYIRIVKELTNNVTNSFSIRKIVFPISNDFFHTDNIQNQTTAGTPQDVLVEYHIEYEEGFDLLMHTIAYLRTLCHEVEVVLVQGNHDRTKSFYLAHALSIFFKNDPCVVFQREHSTTKCVVLGNTFIGYHHGNCKIADLPLLFATGKDSADFGFAQYREIHTGDKHFYAAIEMKGVRIQQVPSLSGRDRWHEDNNYVNNVRAALLFVYHPTKGKIAEFESRI